MKKYNDCPIILRDFLSYHENIKAQSPRTISEYYLDLRMFLRFIKLMRMDAPIGTRLDDIDIRDVNLDFVRDITTSDIFEFLSYLANDRTPNPDAPYPEQGIEAAARARKLSAIKSFYKYLTVRTKQLQENPVADLEYPKLRKSLPRYLTLEQSAALLAAVFLPVPVSKQQTCVPLHRWCASCWEFPQVILRFPYLHCCLSRICPVLRNKEKLFWKKKQLSIIPSPVCRTGFPSALSLPALWCRS